jgi:hypothetical protein
MRGSSEASRAGPLYNNSLSWYIGGRMRIFKIILIAIFLFYALPLNGFCDDAHADEGTHPCVLTCQAPCCSLILPDKVDGLGIPSLYSFFLPSENHTYQNPFILVLSHPPTIVLS